MTCGYIPTPVGLLAKHTHSDDGCLSTADPINVVFESIDADAVGYVVTAIANRATGALWKVPRLGPFATADHQWLQQGGECIQEIAQYVAGPFWERYHVRLWDWPGQVVLAAAHHEFLSLGVNDPPQHLVSSFESGKDSLCQDLTYAGRKVLQNAFEMDNYRLSPYCSGWAASVK